MASPSFVIGVDYGTDSVRSVIVNAADGEEIASSVFYYPRWASGKYCNAAANQFRQHPLDYLEGLEHTIRECIQKAGRTIALEIKGIGIDTTGSSPVAVDESGTPLSLLQGMEENPNAMFVLWKDHTAVKEAAAINEHSAKFSTNYLKFVGGIYSSEWFWAKLLHILREDETVRKRIHSFVEHCDWIPFVLTGGTNAAELKRSVCAAGHKGLWAAEFGGFPPNDFFRSLDPLLKKSDAGRVVFLSSGAGHRAELRAYWGLYGTTKAALDALARFYAAETRNISNVRVNLFQPGPLRTTMRAKAMPGEDPMTLRTPEEAAPKILSMCAPEWTETGKLYDFPQEKVLSFREPA